MIPIAEPFLGPEEEKLVIEGLRSGWISSTGKYIGEFEEAFARFCTTKYAVAVANGTAALHLVLASSDIGPGDEVIVPSLTFVATANAVAYTGAKPIFADSEMETWNIDPEKIKEKINKKTKAIIPVHLYGHPAEMGTISAIARTYNLLLIEDAAEAHGAEFKGKKVGSLGDAGCFSFFANKVITTGEGGMITTNNKTLAEKIRILRDHGASKRRRYYNPYLGFNYRMTNLQAAIGTAQLKKIDKILKRKREIAKLYEKNLEPLVPQVTLQGEASWAKNIYWMYSILVTNDGKINRDYLIGKLKKKGVDSRPFFFPAHKLPRFKVNESLPIAESLAKTGINLPSSPSLTDAQITLICSTIKEIFKKK